MATDVDVQYFSHLNGLTLGYNWGDLIRLLDKALVTGVDFTQITAASIDAQGDVHITLYASHNAMLLQVVELSGFAPASINQKYRIKGVPSTTELILKPQTAIIETSITTVGTGKLASLGYEIIFRDTNDVKRVYRAKNPTSKHPFIRVDESLTSPDGTTGVYTSTYAKYAMVGLLENMTHIDDYENPNVLQLPFDSSNPAKNWKITGSGASVVRGWSKWYWQSGHYNADSLTAMSDSFSPEAQSPQFSIIGDSDAFYFVKDMATRFTSRQFCLSGAGIFSANSVNIEPEWFLMSILTSATAQTSTAIVNRAGSLPITYNKNGFWLNNLNKVGATHVVAQAITPDALSGSSNLYGSSLAPLEIPINDNSAFLRGTLKHVCYSGKNHNVLAITPLQAENSLYAYHPIMVGSSGNGQVGGVYFYLGELE